MMERALRLARPDDASLTNGAANAAALKAIIEFYLDHQTTALGGRHRPHVNVVIDLQQLEGRGQGRLLDGTPVDTAAMRRILCDANIHRVITDAQSNILDFGRSTRTIPAALFTALVLRDQHCRFPDCDRTPHHCEGHHIIAWETGGPTNLNNLALLCKYRHHRYAHGAGWNMTIDPDATLHITDPTGRTMTSHPPDLNDLLAA